MNATTQQNSALNHDEIARLACQIWQTEGSQSGRDQEYWLRAERQLRAISQQGNAPANDAPVKRKGSSATGKSAASQSAATAGSSQTTPQKRGSGKL